MNKLDVNEVSALGLKKPFADRAFPLMLVYRKQSMHMQGFFEILQYLQATHSIDIMAGDFIYDLLKVSQNKFFRYFHRPCPDGK